LCGPERSDYTAPRFAALVWAAKGARPLPKGLLTDPYNFQFNGGMLGILIICIPLLIYIAGALSVPRSALRHPDDFFAAYRKVGVTAFASSSIAYAFQVSTIYPFLLWGASGFYFVPAINTVCWGLGIILFFIAFGRIQKFFGTAVTLHGLLGAQYGPKVRVVASYLTIIGFLGFAIAETYFGSKVLLSIVTDKNIFYLIVLGALLFVFGYIAYGGQLSSLRTDQLQLIISYIGVFGLMLYFFYLIITVKIGTSNILSLGFGILAIYVPIIIIARRFQFIRFSEEPTLANRFINVLLNTMISLLLLAILGVAIVETVRNGGSYNVSNLVNTKGFGTLGLISLILLPLLWQFVDLTNWQRILAVKPADAKDANTIAKNVKSGLLLYAVESPFTWIIFLFFGLLAVTAMPKAQFNDLLIDLPRHLLASPGLFQQSLGYTFIVSVIAIMLSTVDSFIVGSIFTFVYDSNAWTRGLLDRGDPIEIERHYAGIMNWGRVFGLFVILAGVALFVVFDKAVPQGGELFINLLLAFYSAQLSFAPLILGLLFLRRRPSAFWASTSMIAGAAFGIGIGVYSVIWNPDYGWYPIPACVAVATVIYLVGLSLAQRKDIRVVSGGRG
jgi:hypothetical protein